MVAAHAKLYGDRAAYITHQFLDGTIAQYSASELAFRPKPPLEPLRTRSTSRAPLALRVTFHRCGAI